MVCYGQDSYSVLKLFFSLHGLFIYILLTHLVDAVLLLLFSQLAWEGLTVLLFFVFPESLFVRPLIGQEGK